MKLRLSDLLPAKLQPDESRTVETQLLKFYNVGSDAYWSLDLADDLIIKRPIDYPGVPRVALSIAAAGTLNELGGQWALENQDYSQYNGAGDAGIVNVKHLKEFVAEQLAGFSPVGGDGGTGGGGGGIVTESSLSPSLLSKINSPQIALPLGSGLVAQLDGNGKLVAIVLDESIVRDIVRDELSTIGGLSTWAKPTVQGFDDTDVVSFSSVSAMEYCLQGNLQAISDFGTLSNGKYVGTYSVGNFDREAGYVWARTKATNEKAASGWTKSPEFHVAATNTAPNLILSSTSMNQRPPWDGYQSGFYHDPIQDPEGGMTFNVLTAYDSNASVITNNINMTLGTSYCFSGIFRSYTVDLPALTEFRIQSQLSKATFNLTTGAVTGVENATCYFTDLSAQGAQWAGCYMLEFTLVASNVNQAFAMVMNVPNGCNANLWRWQVNAGTRRSTYQPTTYNS